MGSNGWNTFDVNEVSELISKKLYVKEIVSTNCKENEFFWVLSKISIIFKFNKLL